MRRRIYMAALLVGLGLLGALLGVRAQETPSWPSVKPPGQAEVNAAWEPSPAPQSVSQMGIVPVQAVTADAKPTPIASSVPVPPAPGMFPAEVVPAQAIGPEVKGQPASEPPPPMFPETKAPPPMVIPVEETAGPMLNPMDDAKAKGPPSAVTSPMIPGPDGNPAGPPAVNVEPGLAAFPKTDVPPVIPMPGPPSVTAQPNTSPVPETYIPVAVPIRRHHLKPAAPPPTELVSKSIAIPEKTTEAVSPLLTVEKRGPAQLQLGQPARFEIVVRNVGSLPATQVRIEDTLPEHVRFLGGSPHPVLEAGRVVWNIPQVSAGQEQKVVLELQPTEPGDLATQTILSHAMESRVQVRPASITLNVTGPGKTGVGQAVVFEVRLANSSDAAQSDLILNARLSEGLIHQNGQNIESNPFTLAARASKTLTITTKSLHPGRQSLELTVSARGRQVAVANADVFVGEMGLVVHVPATSRIVPGRMGELPIEIGNFESRPVHNLVVTSRLPKGLEFEAASDHGKHHAGAVQWTIDHLAPGQKRIVAVRVKSRAPGDFLHLVSVRGADGVRAQAEGHVFADAASQLTLNATVRDNPLELGKETVFEIRVSNEGNAPESNVQVQAALPDGMVARFVEGTPYRMLGKQMVVFDTIPRLEPHKHMRMRIGVLATTPGEQRLRVQVGSSQLRMPLGREARTYVYGDR